MFIQIWIGLSMLAALVGGIGTAVYFESKDVPVPAVVATPIGTTTPEAFFKPETPKKVAPKVSVPTPEPVVAKPTPAPAPVYYVDPYTKALMDAIEANQRDIERSDRQRQQILDDWADDTRAQVDSFQSCENEIDDAEDDIRAEIQAAGGIGTESQIRAMALQRVDC